MCGITGYWVRRGDPAAWLGDLAGSVEALRNRGPDDSGVWVRSGARVAMGHTRLSILDLSAHGHQPMRTPEGTTTMVFNGEIYNFATVRSELESLGHRFRSSGDSEVVLAAYEQWGVAAAERFVGMFAIAFWNERERRLVLLRDRMGVKPLYYAWDGRAFWFGSELKALRAFAAWAPEIDRDALGEYLQYGYISAPRSIYRGVSKLLPGHWLELGEVGEPVARRYWAPAADGKPLEGSEEELERRLEALLVESFRYRMVSDVPVGVFLSGGLDSSLVAALLQRHGDGGVRTFTIGFEEQSFDESGHARRVAAHLGTRHSERIVTAADMKGVLTHWADLFDEPFGDASGVPTYLVSRLAREEVKVALSADGGDELFCGYSHYDVVLERHAALGRLPQAARRAFSRSVGSLDASTLSRLADRLPLPARLRHGTRRALLDRLAKLAVMMPRLDVGTIYDFAMSFWTPWEISGLLGGDTVPRERVAGRGSVADQMVHSDLRHYLPDDILAKVDRTTMAAGLEGREPMLDHRLVEFAVRLPIGMRRGPLGTKHLLRKILYRHVPRELLERPKQGFAIPLARWLRSELSPLVDEYLAPERIRAGGLFDPAEVRRAVANFRDGGPGNDRLDVKKVWLLLAFEMWRSRWDTGYERRSEDVIHARAVHH